MHWTNKYPWLIVIQPNPKIITIKEVKKHYFQPVVYFIQCLTKEKRIYAKLIAELAFARVSQTVTKFVDMDAPCELIYEAAIYESIIYRHRVSEYEKKREELHWEITRYYLWAEVFRRFNQKDLEPKPFMFKALSKFKQSRQPWKA